jgi:beta-lactam-binding protein with PASTA domain
VPDVEGLDIDSAQTTLRSAGFKVVIVYADTDNPLEADVVLVQDPAGGLDADPGSTVTLTVGRYVAPPPTTTTTPTTTVPETTTPTTPTDTVPQA